MLAKLNIIKQTDGSLLKKDYILIFLNCEGNMIILQQI